MHQTSNSDQKHVIFVFFCRSIKAKTQNKILNVNQLKNQQLQLSIFSKK